MTIEEETKSSDKEKAILAFARDPWLAHRSLFRHRHAFDSPAFHREIVELFHSSYPRVEAMTFRGGAKSTLGEETIIIEACLRRIRNGLVIGETETRAKERLRAIRNEFETNPWIEELFGSLVGPQWGELRIELGNGALLQCYGRGQSLRGVKHLDQRPDFVLIDDLEDEDSVLTPESRHKTAEWFWKTLVPALDDPVATPVRVLATPLHEDALAVTLSRLPSFRAVKIPVERRGDGGERVSAWPSKYPLSKIDELKGAYASAGRLDAYEQEYMCEVSHPASQVFRPEMLTYDASLVRVWQAVYAVYDPARTTGPRSSLTGKVVASWVANRLIVWEASGERWAPDEIVRDIVETERRYRPVAIGVEEDGLNEFLLQPLGQAAGADGEPLPIRAVRAPRGKHDFIRSLQPFFKAREIVFAGSPERFAELASELLNFRPGYAGPIDAVNALAYMLRLRGGLPVYDGFTAAAVAEGLTLTQARPYLAVAAERGLVAVVLAQWQDGRLVLLADAVREGDPDLEVETPVMDMRREAAGTRERLRAVLAHRPAAPFDAVKLKHAVARCGVEVVSGGPRAEGRREVARLLMTAPGGLPALRVSSTASWCLRALQGGYARARDREGRALDEPEANAYSLVMEAVEGLAALSALQAGEEAEVRVEVTADGRRFKTARVR